MSLDLSLEELRVRAARAGLELGAEELARLLPGVNRSGRQAEELRGLISSDDEPAAVFDPLSGLHK
jgi:hypothetical protein